MNQPPYILVDVFRELTLAAQTALGLPNINYQYGYVEELNETLQQYGKTLAFSDLKFPLVWLKQPFKVARGEQGFYGTVKGLQVFVINSTDINWKAKDRMELNFKPVLYPIKDAILEAMNDHEAISYEADRRYSETDRYYWGEAQQTVLSDIVDCLIVDDLVIKLNNNLNCI